MPPRWKKMLLFLSVACFVEGITFSHLGSFFNVYAIHERNLSATQFGIILGSYSVVMLIVTPLTAVLVASRTLEDKTILCSGLMLDAVFTMLMAMASEICSDTQFFLFCLVMRVIQAIGRAAAVLMIYVIAGAQLEEINHIVIPLLETVYGVSVVGPVISGFLNLFGFPVPFVSIGGFVLLFTLSALYMFPDYEKEEPGQDIKRVDDDGRSLWEVSVLVNAFACYHAFYLISANESTLAVKLKEDYGFTSSESGIVFLFSGISYATFGLLSGIYSKKVRDPRDIVLSSLFVIIIGLCLTSPVIPLLNEFWIFCVGQWLLGMGTGPIFVCCYLQSLHYIGGPKPSKDKHAALMGLFNPAACVGCTLGPLISGIMADSSDYGTLDFLSISLTLTLALALVVTVCCFRREHDLVLSDKIGKH